MKRLIHILLAAMLMTTLLTAVSMAADYSYEGSVAYLSDNGNDANDGLTVKTPKKKIATAFGVAGKGGTIVITDVYTYSGDDRIPSATIAGLNDKSKFQSDAWGVMCTGDAEFKNLVMHQLKSHNFIMACGHNLVMGENIRTTRASGVITDLCVRGGADGSANKGDTHVVIKSGTYSVVYGGTRNNGILGNTNITVYGDAVIQGINPGNDGSDNKAVDGIGIVKLIGSPKITSIAAPADVPDGCFLDISEYTGKVNEDWEIVKNGSVVTDASEIEKIVAERKAAAENIVLTGVPADLEGITDIVYLSDNGSDANDGKTLDTPVKTLRQAILKGGNGCTVVIKDKYTYSSVYHIPGCNIVGYKSDAKLIMGIWNLLIAGEVTFDNITLVATKDWSFLLGYGNHLTIGENVTVQNEVTVKYGLSIRAGGDGTAVNRDTCLTIKGGQWNSVFGGTSRNNVNGNTYITVHEGATINNLVGGNDGTSEGHGVQGYSVIKLVGRYSGVNSIRVSPSVLGESYLDISEYSGEHGENWNLDGFTFILSKDGIPAPIKEHYEKTTGIYDLSGIENLIYLSDSGSDENDGRTPDKPKQTLYEASLALGKAGGTVAIVGTYTNTKHVTLPNPTNLTSTCKKDKFVWNYWALQTNNTEIYNLKIIIAKDWGFFLHGGKKLTIGDNVSFEFSGGASRYLGIRAGETGDYPETNIHIKGGQLSAIFTGTKNANIEGNASVLIEGGTVSGIVCGNDSNTGRILGNTTITIKGKPTVPAVTYKDQSDGYIVVDISEYEGADINIDPLLTVIRDKSEKFIPTNIYAKFINGYPDGTFLPDKVMTRAEAVTVVSKLCGFTTVAELPEKSSFSDVANEDWYAANVKYLEQFGMLSFFGERFDAGKGITRAEFVKLISPIVKAGDKTDDISYTDVDKTHAYYNEIKLANNAGLVTGYPDGTFMPDKTLTRAEIVTVANRLTGKHIVESNIAKVNKFSDVGGHWAKSQIVAASVSMIENEIKVWYAGDVYAGLSPLDGKNFTYETTEKVLAGIDVNDADAVIASVRANAEKLKEEIVNAPTSVNVTGTKYYVSADGDDKNDGLTPETAWKTTTRVSGAALNPGDGVFFRRGDVFRTDSVILTKKGVTYSAYGEGRKPEIYASAKNYSGIGFWKATDKANVYVSETTFDADIGLIVFNEGEQWTIKKTLTVDGFDGELKSDLEMYYSFQDKHIYLYSESDPNTRWTSTEIAEGRKIIAGDGNDVVIDNLCLKYCGAHAIGYGITSNLTVQYCEIGWIGGMIQNINNSTTRYGNGVEVYKNCDGYVVEKCYIYQCYDAGVTHQWFGNDPNPVIMKGVRYTDNLIELCTYNIEYCNENPKERGLMSDVEISGNYLLDAGYGWGAQRPIRSDSCIQGWRVINNSEKYYIYDNVIMTLHPKAFLAHFGVEKLTSVPATVNNLFVGARGNRLGTYGYMTNGYTIYDETILNQTIGLDKNIFVFKDAEE
ncbi:MAG: S-layer homology domain-containing protein [Clostridia bacterium]|nr:S-layer homology domain-containing protein [Clostridia bacterium]